jgi:hypothetical protein
VNPIELAHAIEERYRCYLKTTFYFKDPDLRKSFEEALNSGYLSKGPFLEANPVFKPGQTPRDLFHKLLGFQPDEGFLKAVLGDRQLYQHQEKAIQAVFCGRNVVVATGTGSGKTEAFLYPILLHLYQEFREDRLGPGVRVLILYPMNALANDQRERLGEICKRLKDENSSFRFTFGQYIGDTPEDRNDSQRHAQDRIAERERQGYSVIQNGNVVHGELVLRSEMRNSPPHILLTNYSMLEYLLLRPDDSPLFDHGRARWWRLLVLDEAHQYRGSRGIEMAMLLRRLKQRLREGGSSEPFRCIATSATLVGGAEDRVAATHFTSELFGEPFDEEDVILGEPEPVPEPGSGRLSADDYWTLKEVITGTGMLTRLSEIAAKLNLVIASGEDREKAIGWILQHDGRAVALRRLITGQPREVKAVADQVFADLPDGERIAGLSSLVELLLLAKDPVSGAPLLAARFHLFLRSLEGAFVTYWPQKGVLFDRNKAVSGQGIALEVALCRECGQHYFVVQRGFSDGKVQEASRDPNDPDFGATFLRPLEDKGEEIAEDEHADAQRQAVFHLCMQCGNASQSKPACGHDHLMQVIKEAPPRDEDRRDQVVRCGACGYAGRDPVRDVVTGADGPHAVIATTLYRTLPEQRRKVLAFADGRQEAAFFAWYLEASYKDMLSRNLLLKVVKRLNPYTRQGLSLRDLAEELCTLFREQQIFAPAASDLELRRQAWYALYREFLTDEPRISLEGVGLLRWAIKWPDWFKPEFFRDPPWSLTRQEAWDLVFILLNSLRADRAVELRTENKISLNWSDLGLQASQTRFRIGDPKGKKDVRSWDGENGKRAHFLVKLLRKMRTDLSEQEAGQEAIRALRYTWDIFRQFDQNAPSSSDRLLLPVDDARRLNPDWWRVHLIRDSDTIFQCDTCGRLQTVSVYGVCLRHRCPGALRLVPVANLEPNHYRCLYAEELPGVLRVEEHTAQLDKEKARAFQQEFKQGRIHVLSCSTTFELGVDLGDLDTIFLRNVPPEPFNYAQRIGRSGRRMGFPGFVITYCRRNPHDLYHFAEPGRMLNGRVRPPALHLQNKKIVARHLTAIALSAFFRSFPERFKAVEQLFKAPLDVTSELRDFLHQQRLTLERSLWNIVPDSMSDLIENGSWLDEVAGKDSRFALAEAEVRSDYQAVKCLEEKAAGERDYDTAKWAQARAETIAQEEVLSFLSRKAVIPKYGFPVDVVELDTQRTYQNREAFAVLLQRDLSIAISEFAPTSELVANKKLWTSYGLKKVAGKEWPRKHYKICRKHHVFVQWAEGHPEPPAPCSDQFEEWQYVVPCFGFITDRSKPEDPKSRPARVFTTRPYFAGPVDPNPDTINIPPGSPMVTVKKASPGWMVVLCEGRQREGFYICDKCGAGFRRRERAHQNPYGQSCDGTLTRVSLGHEFVTDVLQLRFQDKPDGDTDPVWFAYSLASALVEGTAEVLEVPPTDLSATVTYAQEPLPPIIIYDNVPGGAGLVARLEEERVLKECLKAALQRVSGNCGCGETASCYGCLRSYRNQFAHQYLQRGPVKAYLETLLRNWECAAPRTS